MSFLKSLKTFQSIDLKEMRKPGFLKQILDLSVFQHQLVEKGHGWKLVNQCPICKSTEFENAIKARDVQIRHCLGCDFYYNEKMPVDTGDLYSDEHYLPVSKQSYLSIVDYRKRRFGTERLDLLEQTLGTLQGKTLLDMGCGTGWFLYLAKERGMNVVGVELGDELREFTKAELNMPIYKTLEEVKESIDVITMFDLIEHVENPVELIETCKTKLSKEGIVLAFTPQYDSLAFHVAKEHTNLIKTEHLTYFTKPSVYKLSELTGMDCIYYVTKGIDCGDLKGLFEYQNKPHLAEAIEELADLLQPIIDQAECGNHLRFIFKKR